MKTVYDLRLETLKAFEENEFTHNDVKWFLDKLERDFLQNRGLSRFEILKPPVRYVQERV